MAKTLVIMHLRACNFVGGPEKQILEHFARLDTARFTPILGTFGEGGADPLGDAARLRGYCTVHLPSRSPVHVASIHTLYTVLRQHKVDLLCTHGYKPNILGCLAAVPARIPTIAVSRGWTGESPKIRWYEALDRLFLRFADHVVAVSAGQQQKILASGVPGRKVSVIHNAINLDEPAPPFDVPLRSQLGLPQDALIIASAGRLSPEKNYATMIEVAREVCADQPQAYFVVFGEGVLRPQLEQKVTASGLQGRFLLPGFRKDLPDLLPQIDIFMLPSFTEGLPNVALEAFANQKPIVATAVGGTPEVVQHGLSGFLTTPDDVVGMVTALLSLLTDRELRRQMGIAGFEYIKRNFGFSAQTIEYEKLYTDMCRSFG